MAFGSESLKHDVNFGLYMCVMNTEAEHYVYIFVHTHSNDIFVVVAVVDDDDGGEEDDDENDWMTKISQIMIDIMIRGFTHSNF